MKSEPHFREATESDADVLLDFMQAYYKHDGHGFDREKARTALIGLLRDSRLGRGWLVYDGQTAVGYIVLCLGTAWSGWGGTRSWTNFI